MKSIKISVAAGTLALTALAVCAGASAAADDSGWYVGGNVGASRANIDDDKIASSLLQAGFATTGIDDDDHATGYKLFGGYQINRYFALEAGYFDLGKFSFTAGTVPAGTLNGSIKLKGADLDLVGRVPFTDRFSAFARAGAIYAEAKDHFAGSGLVNVTDPDRRKRAGGYKFGLGLEYDFTAWFGMRTEAERYHVNDAVGNKGDVDLVSLGVVYRFGRHEPATTAYEAPQASPAPAPLLVVVPVAAPTQQYCSILDFQFEINQDDIQREEKERLAVIGTFLKKYPDTTAVIEGHTDNVGNPEQNMKLSQRRAQSVVSYMVETFGIAASRLTAVGYGETRPIGDNRTDEGKRQNRRIGALVACATDIEGLKVVAARVTMALLIEFDRNKADVKPEYREELHKLANFLTANPSATATVEGHTANLQVTEALALEISQRRAQNVVNYLVDNFGIARSRLTAQGFGQARRTAYNTSLEGQQENRRVNVIINYPR